VTPAVFVHSKEDAAKVFTGFRVLYWAIALALVVAALVNRDLIPLAIVWPVVLLLWEWRVRRAPTGWSLEIDERALREVTGDEWRSIERDATSFVRFRRRRMRYAAWTTVQAVGSRGAVELEIGIRDDHRDGIARALRERGWIVEG
jgi:hypothetical protein